MLNKFELQPFLADEFVRLRPLHQNDFEIVFRIASDPLIWEQHPDSDRYKREVFEKYFEGAIASKGAFLIINNQTGKPIGCTRFYDFNEKDRSILIGYTFLSKDHWGTTYNRAVKTLMINHAFQFVDTIGFHIGQNNIRSQKAIERLGAKKVGEGEIAYYGSTSSCHFIYELKK